MLEGDIADLLRKYYSQIKNPNPVLTPREGTGTLKFCEKLMEKAVDFTSRSNFAIHVAHARSKGLRRHMSPVLRRRVIDALPQGPCFHYDPLANRVQCSTTRASRALAFLVELESVTYQAEYDPLIGCHIPADVTLTSALFAALDISENAVATVRRSHVGQESRQRKEQGPDTLGMSGLITKAWRLVRERFRSYQTEPESREAKRTRARRDANGRHQGIVTLVKRQLAREISEGCFTANREAIRHEVGRRVKERMVLSRSHNYSRLATAFP